MGLFDGKVKELGDTLVQKLTERSQKLTEQWEQETNPGQKLTLYVTIFVLSNLAEVINDATND